MEAATSQCPNYMPQNPCSESFYNTHLSDLELKPLNDFLEVEGANGQTVPYLGYVNLDITFPPDFLGTPVDVSTLALVVPDIKTHQPFILVGTNTLDIVYALSSKHIPDVHPVPYGYCAVLKILHHRYKMSSENHHGVVRLHSTASQTIPVRQTIFLEGSAASHSLSAEKAVLVEHPTSFPIPGGLMIQACLDDYPNHQAFLPVLVKNESDHDVILPPRALIAETSAFLSVSCAAYTTPESVPSTW